MGHGRVLRVESRQILGFLVEVWQMCRRMQLLGLGLGCLQHVHLDHHLTEWRSRHELLKVVGLLGMMAGWDSLGHASMELTGQ